MDGGSVTDYISVSGEINEVFKCSILNKIVESGSGLLLTLLKKKWSEVVLVKDKYDHTYLRTPFFFRDKGRWMLYKPVFDIQPTIYIVLDGMVKEIPWDMRPIIREIYIISGE